MISSIFGKTNPINYVIVLVFVFVFYWFVHFFLFERTYSPEYIIVQTAVLAILLFSIFMVNFIISRNKVTDANSYGILFYALLIVLFPETITDAKAIFCSFFLLLAIRRIISMRTLKEIKFKIFDATLWVLFSSLFYDWSLLFLILVFAAIYLYEPKNIRNWIVPLIGILAFFSILMAFLVILGQTGFIKDHYSFRVEFNTGYFFDWSNSLKLTFYILTILALSVVAFVKIGKLGLGRIITLRLIAVSFIIGLAIKLLETADDAFPVMLTFFPAVIFMNNYVETIKKVNHKEIMLFAFVLVPIVVLISNILIK